MKPRRSGLTMVEILVVVGIIALLTGMLIPAVSTVQRIAKEAKQKAQFTAIELGLEAFKNDFGDYPPSDPYNWTANTSTSCSAGAMKLAEAMLGWDLLGVHPDTGWRVDGKNRWPYKASATSTAADPGTYFLYDQTSEIDMRKRKGRYVEMDVANPFRLGITPDHDGLFDLSGMMPCDTSADCFVLCDVFGKGTSVIQSNGARAKAGRPILYYCANSALKFLTGPTDAKDFPTYTSADDDNLLGVIEYNDQTRMGSPGLGKSVWNPLVLTGAFSTAITDPRASTTRRVAYRPDSYILISAGADGLYGTSDDIHNFGR